MASQFVWFDVTTKDPDKTRDFYAELLGWPMPPAEGAGDYRSWIVNGEEPWAGVSVADDATSGKWIPYVQVENLDSATEKATALGGTVVRDKTDGPAGTAVTIADPAGALLALWVPRAG